MAENDSSISVYTLITNLCEKFSNNPRVVRKLRSKLFEILLGKRQGTEDKFHKHLNKSNTFWGVLSWQFHLSTKFGLAEHASDLKEYAEFVEDSYGEPVLRFLMCFCNKPTVSNEFEEISALHDLNVKRSFIPLNKEIITHHSYLDTIVDSPESVWEFVLTDKSKHSDYHNWENFSYSEPEKEELFLSELGTRSSLWLKNLPSKTQYYASHKTQIKNVGEFVNDLKYLLVGVASYSFTYDSNNRFTLIPGVLVEGLTLESLMNFTKDFLHCGNCYKALYEISSSNPTDDEFRQQGYIFMELCTSISRYLEFYRSAIVNLPNTLGLLELEEHTSNLRDQIKIMSGICKAGPYSESERIPHGVSLLNYLYQTTLNLTEKNTLLVLCSVLFPCCQVYFSQLLKPWLLDGTVQDPYNEFFIKSHAKYTSTTGRTFWTRSFTVREDIVPDFLADLQQDILNCGKAMCLLKMCVHSSKLRSYLMGRKPHIVSCCLTSEQLKILEQNANSYYEEVSAECDVDIGRMLSKIREQDPAFIDMIAKKRAVTLKRIMLEKAKAREEENLKKGREMAILKEQYDLAALQKEVQMSREIKKGVESLESELVAEEAQKKLVEEETKNLVEFYEELGKVAENRKKAIEDTPEISTPSSTSAQLQKENLDKISGKEDFPYCGDHAKIHSSKSLDAINANNLEDERTSKMPETFEIARKIKEKVMTEELGLFNSTKLPKERPLVRKTLSSDQMTEAQKNKHKVMTEELGVFTSTEQRPLLASDTLTLDQMTEAQKNKLHVLSSEFGIDLDIRRTPPSLDGKMTELERNRNHVLGSEFGKEPVEIPETLAGKMTDLQRNRNHVLGSEFGMNNVLETPRTSLVLAGGKMTELQRNRNHVLSSEIGTEDVEILKSSVIPGGKMTELQRNRNHMLNTEFGINLGFCRSRILDNDRTATNGNFLPAGNDNNDNFLNENEENSADVVKEIPKSISLNIGKANAASEQQTDKPVPMSLDSTPLSEFPLTPASKMFSSIDIAPTTASTDCFNNISEDEGFHFNQNIENSASAQQRLFSSMKLDEFSGGDNTQQQKPIFSKKISREEAAKLNMNNLKLFLYESVRTTLITQTKLVNGELLKYFISDLRYFQHLGNLRDYFFLQDGEFGRNITENLFEKLYDVNFPTDLINCRTLQKLVYEALHTSSKFQDNAECLSFKINFLPKQFRLRDPDVLDCLSLTYKVRWPLNVLLPADTVAKYDEVFKFLIKLSRISWVLKKTYAELRILAKETGKKEIYLMMSPHYRKLHQCRHVMLHFVQTLQNYIVGEVLQSSWEVFQKNLSAVNNIDVLYLVHTKYIQEVLFLCLLNQKSAPLRKVIQKIFIVILKFYDYLRSRSWTCTDGVYVHPNFAKLESIFMNFEEFVVYLFRVGRKVAKSGYQPHLQHLLDMLDVNGYYSAKVRSTASNSGT